ncbi:unnamed protein product [Closterium sp. NIES-65]|nr:unnamed protein product [Closterium sp. NIES-65]
MWWCPVPASLIRHLLLLELERLGVVLGSPDVYLPVPPPLTPPILPWPGVLPSGSLSQVCLPFQSLLLIRHLVRPAMPISIGDEYYSYSPRPFVVASAAIAPPAVSSSAPAAMGMLPLPAPRSVPSSVTQAGLVLAPAAAPVPVVALMSAPAAGPDPAPASSPAPALALASAPAPAPGLAAASDPAHPPAPAPVVPSVPVGVSAPLPAVAASSGADGAASMPPPAAAAADPTYRPPPATSAGLSSAEVQSARASPPVAPAPLPAATPAPPPTVQVGPVPAPLAPVPPAQRHPRGSGPGHV